MAAIATHRQCVRAGQHRCCKSIERGGTAIVWGANMKTAIALGLLALAAPKYAGASSYSFGPVEHLTAARNLVHAVAIGDANGDGRMDLAVSQDPTWTEHELA